MSRRDASKIVAKELRLEWIKKNVYPMLETSDADQMFKASEHFNNLRKTEHCELKRKSTDWYKNARDFIVKLTEYGYDIKATDISHQNKLEEEFQVKRLMLLSKLR